MFSRILNNAKLLIITLSALIVVMIVVVVLGSSTKITQPIQYNHKIHIEEVGLTCVDCHIEVEKMPTATIPNVDLCQECHSDEPVSDSPEEIKLLKYISEGKRIPWIQIYKVPDHVYFSHRRHVTIGELQCSLCHGDVENMTEPIPRPVWNPTMNNCINCHKQDKISYDCLACHI